MVKFDKLYEVDGEKIDIMAENWDYLIILDACRFDFFKGIYKDFFKNGTLKKAISPGTHTMDWLNKVFGDNYFNDVVYVSASPFITSKVEVLRAGLRFYGKKHFFEVIDVWKWGWDDRLGTVPPRYINEATLRAKEDYKDKRFILHYLQPHAPYIGKNYVRYISKEHREGGRKRSVRIRGSIGKLIQKSLGIERRWKIGKLLGVAPSSQSDSIGYKEGMVGLRKAYKENLELVLGYVAELSESLPGNFLITADHGELLGEHGKYEHYERYNYKELIEVPWLSIKGDRIKQRKRAEEDRVKEKIRRWKKTEKI